MGVSFSHDGHDIIASTADGAWRARLRHTDQVTFESRAGKFTEAAYKLAQDFAPTGSATDIEAWYAGRAQLVRVSSRLLDCDPTSP